MHEFDLSDPDQRNQCAAEYVLGTLDQQEKIRFEALLAISHDLQAEVEQWREHLDILNSELQPIAPPKTVWPKISDATASKQRLTLYSWRTLSFLSVLFAVALGFFVTQSPRTQDVYVYLINNQQEQPGWMVHTALAQDELVIQTLHPGELPKDQHYELWLTEKGHEPMTLGFLPRQGEKRITIPQSWKSRLLNCEIVVTLEGPKGAPNGYELGPVSDRAHWQPIRL